MATPTLSICFANYNYARYLTQCLRGFLHQSFSDFEIVVTDDGSTDGSQDILREYERTDRRIRVTYFDKNRGVGPAVADAFSKIRGRYLFTTASDDFVVNRDFFNRAVTTLENDTRPAGFYGVCGIYLDEKDKLTGAMGTAEVEGYNTPQQCCVGYLQYRSVVTTPSCVFRTKAYFDQGASNMEALLKTMGSLTDYYLNHALAFQFGMFFEKTLFSCQRIYEARTNYSANLNIYAHAAHLCEMEKCLRLVTPAYPDIEKDWTRWRAMNLLDSIKKSGVPL
jgi:glycosyltransferase involved in cell wall biosynthesis